MSALEQRLRCMFFRLGGHVGVNIHILVIEAGRKLKSC
jgi:hypothetical protein